MNREEFLKQLQEALVGRVPDQVVQENIIYYRRYISEQISGRVSRRGCVCLAIRVCLRKP